MNALNPTGWRPEMGPAQHPDHEATSAPTFTGNRALQLEEALLFQALFLLLGPRCRSCCKEYSFQSDDFSAACSLLTHLLPSLCTRPTDCPGRLPWLNTPSSSVHRSLTAFHGGSDRVISGRDEQSVTRKRDCTRWRGPGGVLSGHSTHSRGEHIALCDRSISSSSPSSMDACASTVMPSSSTT